MTAYATKLESGPGPDTQAQHKQGGQPAVDGASTSGRRPLSRSSDTVGTENPGNATHPSAAGARGGAARSHVNLPGRRVVGRLRGPPGTRASSYRHSYLVVSQMLCGAQDH